ncbi:Cro protein [Mycobacterium phage Validus]|uniref:Cro protein n=1 Tax=Mycobacterium phage Validus TaxID=1414747 RepID=V5UQT8_9CAUD|nr:transcriptional repressor [Mycobacterium phage Validus]AHB79578.1 Cro protein [Mycobacterium phage Validus]
MPDGSVFGPNGLPFPTVQNFKHELRWNPERVANVLAANGIRGRYDLVKRLGLTKSTVYATFGPDWSGVATHNMIATLAAEFDVPIEALVDVTGRAAA